MIVNEVYSVMDKGTSPGSIHSLTMIKAVSGACILLDLRESLIRSGEAPETAFFMRYCIGYRQRTYRTK